MKLYHLNIITDENSDQLNREGWSVQPWKMHADITMNQDLKAAAVAFSEGAYLHVATIEEWVSIGTVFGDTQNLTLSGWANDQRNIQGDISPILCYGNPANDMRHRSTSVGDIVELPIDYRDGVKVVYFLCDTIGWTEIPELEKAA